MSYTEIRSSTATAVRQAKAEIDRRSGNSPLFGFALCTDDDVSTLYHVACTTGWVDENKEGYPDIGYIYVDWAESGDDAPFDRISTTLARLYEQDHGSDAAWASARDRRFEALVLALADCRQAGAFDDGTLLCVGSTDPSDHLEALAMNAVDRLNAPEIADRFAAALGYEEYR